ncbi:amino acid ABC transporter substrate-binding protein [Marinobacter panjinensis]|uniref:Amino acid ABC transporter substrate-binding protein n=1 Tax=Marinobacter panjinensis TaxID=2576384 RepID=A0A4U6R335_9GAMM|nr:transporter substrate-binding domain-containing protein [Marinobacter panjinensis]MCR8913484.1 transporter substrate-binding domain-containing protein [Marinobacter panjinensis]TKV67853.1 amino acid ABC transporter substrate-binding protein [Marinobacter panjinensis]
MKLVIAHIVALVVLWSTPAFAHDDERQLSISVGDWPPFFVEGEPGQGSVARLVSDIFAEAGYEVEFHFLPWKRAYREAAAGKHDATAIWMYAADREKDFVYSDPVMNERFVLFYRKAAPIHWDQIADLSNLRLGASIGYSYGPKFDRAVENEILDVEWVASTELNFRRLLYGRIDAFPEEINVGYYILRRETDQEEAHQITHHPEPISENKSFLLFPADEPETERLREIFNRGLKTFRDDGRYSNYFESRPQASLNSSGQ